MKTQKWIFMAKVFIALFFCGIIVFWGFQAFAEEWWTEAQKEVWKTVEARWELIIKGDAKALTANPHEGALSWWPQQLNPVGKEYLEGAYKGWFGLNQPVSYELNPLAINIVRNIATVFFYSKWEGKAPPEPYSGRNFQVYIKQDGKWRMLGSMSSPCEGSTVCY